MEKGGESMNGMYGKELIIDMKKCDISKFTRESIKGYFEELCDNVIDMQREDLHFWDDEGGPEGEKRTEDHVVGITAVQFIITSSIVIHALTNLKEAYINIFSCKEFNDNEALTFTRKWFDAGEFNRKVVERGMWEI